MGFFWSTTFKVTLTVQLGLKPHKCASSAQISCPHMCKNVKVDISSDVLPPASSLNQRPLQTFILSPNHGWQVDIKVNKMLRFSHILAVERPNRPLPQNVHGNNHYWTRSQCGTSIPLSLSQVSLPKLPPPVIGLNHPPKQLKCKPVLFFTFS